MTPDERRAIEARLTKAVAVTERAKLRQVRVQAADIRVLLDALSAADARAARLRAVVEGVLECFEHGDKWTKAATENVIAHMRAALEETQP